MESSSGVGTNGLSALATVNFSSYPTFSSQSVKGRVRAQEAYGGELKKMSKEIWETYFIYIIIWLSPYVLFVQSLSPPKPAGLDPPNFRRHAPNWT
jgi:hypothetical protein